MGVSFREGWCGLILDVVYHERPAGRPWGRGAKAVWSCGRCALWSCHPLHDLGGVTAWAQHRHASHVALLLKKVSAWHGAWSHAHLHHALSLRGRVTHRSIATNRHEYLHLP